MSSLIIQKGMQPTKQVCLIAVIQKGQFDRAAQGYNQVD